MSETQGVNRDREENRLTPPKKQMFHIAACEVKCTFEVYLVSNYLWYIFLEVTLVLMGNHLGCSIDSISVIQSHNLLQLLSTHHSLLPIPPNSPGCHERQISIRCWSFCKLQSTVKLKVITLIHVKIISLSPAVYPRQSQAPWKIDEDTVLVTGHWVVSYFLNISKNSSIGSGPMMNIIIFSCPSKRLI